MNKMTVDRKYIGI